MQNDTNRSKPPGEGRFRSRQPQETPSRGDPRQAVRQGRTDVVTRRQTETPQPSAQRVPVPQEPPKRSHNGRPEQRQPQPGRTERAVPPGASERQRSRPAETGSVSVRPPASPTHHEERARQVVIGKPKYQKEAERKPEPVIIDSPDIEALPKAANDAEKACGTAGSVTKDERKFYLQRPRDISTLRKMLILVFGFLFLWCLAPAFFHIRGIGVFSSSAVMLGICLTAMFWHLIDRNWTFKKAAVVSLAALLFTACVAAFGIVSGMMLKASLTAVPKDCPNYTVVVLGCKAHGDQPSWMLNDRLEKAYSILSEHPNLKCVVTGGMGDDEQFTEAYVMRKYLVEKGISPDRIYTEELSGSTEENLLYTKSLIRLNGLSENIVIVTDRFHELRARIWAEKAGFKKIYSGCCETRIYLLTGYWFREMFGLARLYVFGV